MTVRSFFSLGAALALSALLLLSPAACSDDDETAVPTRHDDPAQAEEVEGDDAPDDNDSEDDPIGDDEPATAQGAPDEAEVGQLAPDFTLPGADGEEYTLADFRGQWVILEWINHDCPFVRKFYEPGEMQDLQAEYTDPEGAGAAWFSIASSGPGQQGHESPERWNELTEEKEAEPTAVLIDEEGTVGRAYGARTTPHMYIIDPDGTLLYHGAIDDNSSRDPADIEDAENYVEAVMTAALAGEDPPYEYRDPYGCSVHYGSAD